MSRSRCIQVWSLMRKCLSVSNYFWVSFGFICSKPIFISDERGPVEVPITNKTITYGGYKRTFLFCVLVKHYQEFHEKKADNEV